MADGVIVLWTKLVDLEWSYKINNCFGSLLNIARYY